MQDGINLCKYIQFQQGFAVVYIIEILWAVLASLKTPTLGILHLIMDCQVLDFIVVL